MKKFLLFTLSIFILTTAQSQDIEMLDAETEVSGFSGTAAADLIDGKINIRNNTSSALDLLCTREIIVQEAPGADERFCWGGLCYENGTETSFFSQALGAGETITSNGTDGFTGYYEYNGEDGVCQIKYRFYDMNDESISSEIIITYCVSPNGQCDTSINIVESEELGVQLSASPNPASDNFLISYSSAEGGSDNYLVIRDALGKEIYRTLLPLNQGVINFNASDFETGMYFYSILNDNKSEKTKRLIISH